MCAVPRRAPSHNPSSQAEHTAVAKALYDYEATQSTELDLKEDELVYVYGKDEEWLLVQSQTDDSKVGYVPGNYVEEVRRHTLLHILDTIYMSY